MAPVSRVQLEIPDDILTSLHVPPDRAEEELMKELAVALYGRGALSFAQVRGLTDLTRREFDALLGERRVPRQYDSEDLSEDLAYAEGD